MDKVEIVIEPSDPKTLRELRDFLNGVDEAHLDQRFLLRQENDLHCIHFLDINDEDLYHDPEEMEVGNMKLSEWEEYYPETDRTKLVIGIPKGTPMIGEDF